MVINILIAFFLDLLIGDPAVKIHPVALMGKLIQTIEKFTYKIKYKIIGGFILFLLTTSSVFITMLIINRLKDFLTFPLMSINPVTIIFLFFLFCNKTMLKEVKAIYQLLINENIVEARKQVGRIVGRDTSLLDKKAIIRATVESLAENIVDGFTAPLFYTIIGGLPLGYFYKTVNTLDSMVGYKNERYIKYGRFSARADDILNFIPARINLWIIYAVSRFKKETIRAVKKYAHLHSSPNSGLSETAFASILGISLGGPSVYHGRVYNKPWLGENKISDMELENPDLILKAVSIYKKVIYSTLFILLIPVLVFNLPFIFK